jgi:LPS-assembly lipoprotein|tara:strand:+ start:16085 stop:16657 length:573 start_codon:yes stop_codon:yes gene_type:complete
MYRRFTHYSLILGITCLLGSCGFHLRGMGNAGASLPESWKSMYLMTGNPNGEFSRDVSSQLAANGVQWTDREKANFSLVLGPEQFEQRSLSLNSEARVAEYELTMRSEFSVRDAENNEIVALTTVTVVKQMENDPRNAVGKEGEVRLIQTEMRTDLAQQIMRRISFYAASITQSNRQPEKSPPKNQPTNQ